MAKAKHFASLTNLFGLQAREREGEIGRRGGREMEREKYV